MKLLFGWGSFTVVLLLGGIVSHWQLAKCDHWKLWFLGGWGWFEEVLIQYKYKLWHLTFSVNVS